ncbi:phosphatidylserine decarboxylase, partial [Vibrio parahaemolyticus]|uniref:phosphatidylserine decarboxylase n=2 Tax=Gammaproteobacteria TaxID=1236 RepID=UPI001168B37C
SEGAIFLRKGEEMGLFKLGSTVVNLFEANKISFNPSLIPGYATRMGELLAETVADQPAEEPTEVK